MWSSLAPKKKKIANVKLLLNSVQIIIVLILPRIMSPTLNKKELLVILDVWYPGMSN